MPAPRLAWIATAVIAVVAVAALAIALREPAAPQRAPTVGPTAAGGSAGSPAAGSAAVPAAGSAGSGDSAEQLIAAARAALTDGDLARARTLLARAYALDPAPSTLLDLAVLELSTGNCREARRATQRVIDEAPAEIAEPARRLLARIGRCD
jgi:tetratricopeptide repeat protein